MIPWFVPIIHFFKIPSPLHIFLLSPSLPPCLSTEGLNDVILYHQPDDKKKNRGFCFLEYEDHKTAAQARRRLMSGKVKVWGNVVTVEWADPIEDPDPEVMAKVKMDLRTKEGWLVGVSSMSDFILLPC